MSRVVPSNTNLISLMVVFLCAFPAQAESQAAWLGLSNLGQKGSTTNQKVILVHVQAACSASFLLMEE